MTHSILYYKQTALMKRLYFLIALFLTACTVQRQSQEKDTLKFDFGTSKAEKGYVAVTPEDIYSIEKGFGFDFGTKPKVIDYGGKSGLISSFVNSDDPYYFSIKLPEGNYKVTVTLGDLKRSTTSTIKAESRRLMLEDIDTEPGEIRKEMFIVNIKDRNIDADTRVGLKERELTKLDWDEKLTLEFNLQTSLHAIEIAKVEDQITIFLAGNSTVVNQEEEPWASWGQMIPRFFKPGVANANHAESGLSLGSFIGSRRLDKILSVIKDGDYVFVEFGHNDEKEKGPNDGPYKSYTERLKLF